MSHLSLSRPLVVLDLETTGIHPGTARIVEVGLLRICPADTECFLGFRVRPEIPIPAEATACHGITDEAVRGMPRFGEKADEVLEFIDGCDLAGFNLIRFDLPCLSAELRRVGRKLRLTDRAVVDAQAIFHAREPRNLATAVRHYCRREHVGAHGAEADVRATLEVLQAQVAMYGDLPRAPAELGRAMRPEGAIDLAGCFVWRNDRVTFTFGKHQGKLLTDADAGYLRWMLSGDFLDDTLEVVRKELARRLEVVRKELARRG